MSILYLKGSFEDEGLTVFEVQILSAFATELKMPLAFKIGGCEAKSDILTALNYGAHCIVAPMVETEFAASKFISATEPHLSLFKERNINIETITAVENVREILDKHHENINGIVVGRTDLALSMGLTKKDVDSAQVMEQVEKALTVAKEYGLLTTMGGSVSTNSIPCVVDVKEKGLLDRFETRKVIMETTSDSDKLKSMLDTAFSIETDFLDRTLINYNLGTSAARSRIKAIKNRGK
tara:strand:+ start:2365 stop:3078 length:714 start_codon:yes stop_codon:yes gene_type:complete